METTVSGGTSPLVKGNTNLPDGTVLKVQLWPPYPACAADATCSPIIPAGGTRDELGNYDGEITVQSGKFEFGPNWNSNQLKSGKYILEVVLDSGAQLASEPSSVRAIIGDNANNVRGPLVGACCFGVAESHGQEAADKAMAANKQLNSIGGPNIYYARYVNITDQNSSAAPDNSSSPSDRYTGDMRSAYSARVAQFESFSTKVYFAEGCKVIDQGGAYLLVTTQGTAVMEDGLRQGIPGTELPGRAMLMEAQRRGLAEAAAGCSYWHSNPNEVLEMRQIAQAAMGGR